MFGAQWDATSLIRVVKLKNFCRGKQHMVPHIKLVNRDSGTISRTVGEFPAKHYLIVRRDQALSSC